jgi:hypothetical protein
MAAVELAETISPDEREALDALERSMRWRDTPKTLITNCATGESISANGNHSYETVGRLERIRSDALERDRRG